MRTKQCWLPLWRAVLGAALATLVWLPAAARAGPAPAMPALTPYVVTRLGDAGTGAGHRGDLRYCISQANTSPGRDLITFHPGLVGTISLTASLPGLTDDLAIRGPGAHRLTVDGSGSSVFAVGSGVHAVLTGLKITGGVGNGGGIFNQGTLTLNRVTVRGNVAGDPTNGGGTGAGIWNYLGATLTVNRSTVHSNAVHGNASYNPSRGGGIANYGVLRLNNTTVSGNAAAQGFGGGIANYGVLRLNNATVSGNTITGPGGASGGIDNHSGTVIAHNSIIAGNTHGDLAGVLMSRGHNLIGDSHGGSGYATSDLLDVDPKLGHLKSNGGTTATHALLPGSPAINAGDNTGAGQWDQRGWGFHRLVNGTIDIGAFEVQ